MALEVAEYGLGLEAQQGRVVSDISRYGLIESPTGVVVGTEITLGLAVETSTVAKVVTYSRPVPGPMNETYTFTRTGGLLTRVSRETDGEYWDLTRDGNDRVVMVDSSSGSISVDVTRDGEGRPSSVTVEGI